MNEENRESNSLDGVQMPDSSSLEGTGRTQQDAVKIEAPLFSEGTSLEEEIQPQLNHGLLRRVRKLQWPLAGVVLVLIIAGVVGTFRSNQQRAAQTTPRSGNVAAGNFSNISLPAAAFASITTDTLQSAPALTINGRLTVNDSLVLTPQTQPALPVSGQLYYDKTSNSLRYFNGTSFVSLVDSKSQVVQTIGGLSGTVGVGRGLTTTGGLLANGGVLSLQGLTGDVSLTGESGISVTGTVIRNTGVTSIGGLTGTITLGDGFDFSGGRLANSGILSVTSSGSDMLVSDDGHGNITLTGNSFPLSSLPLNTIVIGRADNTLGSVASSAAGLCLVSTNGAPVFQACPGGGLSISGTSGALAKFGGSGTVVDSLVSESGSTVNVAGGLDVSGQLRLPALSNGLLQNSAGTISGGIVSRNDTALLSGVLSIANGGTGRSSFTSNGIVYGNAAGILNVTTAGTSGQLLIANGSGVPTFVSASGDVTISATGVTTIANGSVTNAKLTNSSLTVTAGTNLTGGGTVALGGTITLAVASSPSFSGTINSGNGYSLNGTSIITNLGILQNVTGNASIITNGTFAIARGGTGLSTAPTNGQLLIGNGTGYTQAGLTAGTGISITNGAGSIAVAVDGTVCTTTLNNCATIATNFIQNGITTQTANFNIQSASTSSPIAVFQGAAGQTGDFFVVKSSTNSNYFTINQYGQASFSGSSYFASVVGIQVPATSGVALRISSTSAQEGLTVGNAASPTSGLAVVRFGGTAGRSLSYGADGTMLIKAGTNQTTNLFQIQDSTAALLSGFNVNGQLFHTSGSFTGSFLQGTLTANSTYTLPDTSGTICLDSNNCGFAAAVGSANYIRNGTAVQTANFNIVSSNASAIGAVIQGAIGQTANIFNVDTASGTHVFQVTGAGNTVFNGNAQFGGNVGIGTPGSSGQAIRVRGTGGTATMGLSASGTGNLLLLQGNQFDVLAKFDNGANFSGYGTNMSLGNLSVPAFTTASTGTAYYYVVTALNAQGETVASTPLGMADNTSTLTWSQISGATKYKIYRNTSTSFTTGTLLVTTTSDGTTITFTDTGAATTTGLPPTAPTGTGLTVQGWSGQTSNLFRIQDASAATLLGVSAAGDIVGRFNGDAQHGLLKILPLSTSSTGISFSQDNAGTTLINLGTAGLQLSSNTTTNGYVISIPGAATLTLPGALLNNAANNGLGLGGVNPGNIRLFVQTGQFNFKGQVIKGLAGQTADLFELQDATSGVLSGFNANGQLFHQSGTFSGTFLQGTLTANRVYDLPDLSGTICLDSNNCGFAVADGSANYIQNGTIVQTANFNIQSGSTSSVTAVIQGAAGQTADIFNVKSASGNFSLRVIGNGETYAYAPSNNTAVFFAGNNGIGSNALGVPNVNVAVAGNDGGGNRGAFAVRGANGGIAYFGGTGGSTNYVGLITNKGGVASNNALVLQGGATQTGDLLQLQNSNGTVFARSDANGNSITYGTNTTLNNLTVPAFTTASTGTAYYYVITALNAQAETVASASLGMADNTSSLAWNQVNGAISYKIYRNTANSFTAGSLLLTTITNGSTLIYTDTGSATTTGLPPTTTVGTGLTLQGWASQSSPILQVLNADGTSALNLANNILSIGTTANPVAVNVKSSAAGSINISNTGGQPAINIYNTSATKRVSIFMPNSATGGLAICVSGGSTCTTTVLNIAAGGATTFNPSTDITTAFSLQNSSNVTYFVGDATNGRIGINYGSTAPLYTLDVNGDINTTGSVRTSGTTRIDSSGNLTAGTGSFSGNVGINSNSQLMIGINNPLNASATLNSFYGNRSALILHGVAAQTADLLQNQDTVGNILGGFNGNGRLYNQSGLYRGTLVQGGLAADRNYTLPDSSGTICLDSGNCAVGAGSGNYIHNGTGLQTANFNIQSAAANTITAVLQGAAGQTADLLQMQLSDGTVVARFAANGSLKINGSFGAGAPFAAANFSAGDTGTVANWLGYAPDGTTLTSRIAVDGSFQGGGIRSLDGTVSVALVPSNRVNINAPAVWLNTNGSGIRLFSPDGSIARTLQVGSNGLFNIPVGTVADSWTANNTAFAITAPGGSTRTTIGNFGNMSINVSNINGADPTLWGSTVPLAVNHDGAGTLSGDLLTVSLAGNSKFNVTKAGNVNTTGAYQTGGVTRIDSVGNVYTPKIISTSAVGASIILNDTVNSAVAIRSNTGFTGDTMLAIIAPTGQTAPTTIMRSGTGQTSNLLELQNPTGNVTTKFDANGNISGNGTSLTLAGLPAPSSFTAVPQGTTGSSVYTYSVRAINAQGEYAGAFSSITTGNATLNSTNYNLLTWSAVPGATGYKIYVNNGNGSLNQLITTLGNVTTYSDNGSSLPSGPYISSSALSSVTGGQTLRVTTSQGSQTNALAVFQSVDGGTPTTMIGGNAQFSTRDGALIGSNGTGTGSTNYALTVVGGGSKTATLLTQTAGAAVVGQIIQGATSQTADLLQIQNSSGAVLSRFDANGNLATIGSVTSGGGTTAGLLVINDGAGHVATLGTAGALSGNANFLIPAGTPAGNYTLCTSANNCNNAPVSGSGSYIQNGTGQQTANFNIVSSSSTSVAALIQGAGGTTDILQVWSAGAGAVKLLGINNDGSINITSSRFVVTTTAPTQVTQTLKAYSSQTADLLQIQDSSGTVLSGISSNGTIYAPNVLNLDTPNGGGIDLKQYGLSVLNVRNFYSTLNSPFTINNSGNNYAPNLTLKVYDSNQTQSILAIKNGSGGLIGGIDVNGNFFNGMSAPVTGAKSSFSSGAAGSVGLAVLGVASQTADLLQLQNSSSTVLSGFNAAGNLYLLSGSFTGTLGQGVLTANRTYTLPDASGTICLDTGNCPSGGGSGVATVGALDGGTANADGATISGSTIYLQSAGTSYAGLVNTGTQSFAGDKTFTGNVIAAAGQSLTLTGGNTASRPASPTEGMVYYDTATKQLLVYANGKWQGDRMTSTKIVAASNTSQAVKDSADYVATGTGDQTVINTALTAAAGGKVYLTEGTFVINGTISVPNNTTLTGAGAGTEIQLAAINVNDNMIENTDATTGTGITIENLRINGRKDLNTSGTQYGIYLTNMGSSTRAGGSFKNLTISNLKGGDGMHTVQSYNNTISDNTFMSNDFAGLGMFTSGYNTITGNHINGNYHGIYINSANNTISGNTFQGNTADGIQLSSATNNTISTNSFLNNPMGIYAYGGNNNTYVGNNIQGSTTYGIWLESTSNNLVSGNTLTNNGGSTTNEGIRLYVASSNTIIGNTITDTSATTTNYAIEIGIAMSKNNILSGNSLGGGTISDGGTGTIYSNQQDASGNIINRNQGGGTSLGRTTAGATLDVQGGVRVSQLPTPAAPTLATSGTTGTTTYGYRVSALDGNGETLASNETTIATGNATLTAGNYVTVTWTQVSGAVQYKVYRTTSNGTPATTGLISTVSGNITSQNDTGLAASGSVPAANTTGGGNFAGLLQGATASFSGANSLSLGTANTNSGSIQLFSGLATGSVTLTLANPGSNNYTLSIPTLTSNDTICTVGTGCGSGAAGVATVGALDGGTANADGATISGSTIYLQSAGTSYAGLVNTGTQSFAGDKTFTGNVIAAAGQSLTLTGGNTASRPASPTEGMVYYDTATKQLLVYANGKWQGDRSTSSKIVAMGATSGCTGSTPVASPNPDGADYVVTSCTSAQATINAALASLPATGGSVYLMEGTYIVDGSISVPNNVTLAGSGRGTVIRIMDSTSAVVNAITNTDTTTGTGVVIRDLQINTSSTHTYGTNGIYFSGMGAANRDGGKIINTYVNHMYSGSPSTTGYGVFLVNSSYNTISANTITNNGTRGINNDTNSTYNTITGNIISSNDNGGMTMAGGYNSITGNTLASNTGYGIINSGGNNVYTGNVLTNSIINNVTFQSGSDGSTFTGNHVMNNPSSNYSINLNNANKVTVTGNTLNAARIYLTGANNNVIANNKIYDPGTTTANGAITVSSSSNNTITGNDMTDSSCTTTCYAIDVQDSASTANYFSNNRFSGSAANQATINDLGTGTVYANQQDGSGNLINKSQGGGMSVGKPTATATLDIQGGLRVSQLPTPAAPTLATGGTAGSITYGYKVSAVDGNGETLASTETTITTGPATLSTTNYVTVSWTPISGAVQYRVYRTTANGTPATTGSIATVAGNTTSLKDTGLAASGVVNGINTTGGATLAGTLMAASINASSVIRLNGIDINNAGTLTNVAYLSQANTFSQGVTIKSGTAVQTGLVVQGATGQTGDLLQFQNAGGTVLASFDKNGNLTLPSITVGDLLVTGNITINGHLLTGGTTPTIAANGALCAAPTLTITGNDAAGMITMVTAAGCTLTPGMLATITFAAPFSATPRVVMTPANGNAATANQTYVDDDTISTTGFNINTLNSLTPSTTYKWYYHNFQ